MSTLPKYIYKKGNGYRAQLPRRVAKVNGLHRQIGWRSDLERAVELRNARFTEMGIMEYLEGEKDVVVPEMVQSPDGVSLTDTDSPNVKILAYKGAAITTLDELLEAAEIDLDQWEIADKPKPIINSWGNIDGNTNFQVKCGLQRKAFDVEYFNNLLKDMPRAKKLKKKHAGGNHLLELFITDVHFGGLGDPLETGEAAWNATVAKSRYLETIERLLRQSLNYSVEKINYVIGSDLLNIDDRFRNSTTKGTLQDSDLLYYRMIEEGMALVFQSIEMIRQIAPVEIISCLGNHDNHAAFHLAHAVAIRYENAKDVTVDTTPQLHKAFTYGDVMMCYSHGNGVKAKDWQNVISARFPEKWGQTKHRYLAIGHKHTRITEQFPGLLVRQHGSISGATYWESGHGYCSPPTASGIIYHKHRGTVSELVVNF